MDQSAAEPPYHLEEYGADPAGEPFLSIGIPTWRRASHLRAFLQRLAPVVAASPHRARVEVVISNNASPDDTSAVIRDCVPLLAPHCRVRVYTQTHNIGGEPNFRFVYEHARGTYVWSCSDHDVLHADQFDPLIEDLERFRPPVCISSFVNYASGKDQVHLSGGAAVTVVTDEVEAVRQMYQLGKLTQYVLRRERLTPEEQAVSEQASRGRVWFSVLGVVLFLRREQRLLLRSGVIGHTERDGLDLMFPARIYGELRGYILYGVGDHPRRAEIKAGLPEMNVWPSVVGHLFRNTLGLSRMQLDCAYADYLYARENLGAATMDSWRNMLKMPVILALFPLRYRWRRMRER